MRIVFMGTPDFAVPSLCALSDAGHDVAGVFCQPDRVAGRGKKTRVCAVKEAAVRLGVSVFQPESVKGVQDLFLELAPECVAVAAYGQILPKDLLVLPVYGCVNVHASLLPRYRGAAPIHRAVMNGEDVTGVTIMLMDEGLDTGDVLAAKQIPIGQNATMGEIHDELAIVGAHLLVETLKALEGGRIKPSSQVDEATYAGKLEPADEIIRWEEPASVIHNQIRGLNPWPGAYTSFKGEKVKIWQSRLVKPEKAQIHNRIDSVNEPEYAGCIIGVTALGLLCRTGKDDLRHKSDLIEILEVQPAGKKRMSSRAFANGRPRMLGERFGDGLC